MVGGVCFGLDLVVLRAYSWVTPGGLRGLYVVLKVKL